MELVGQIRTFNTNRGYAANGQPIVWGIIRHDDGSTVVAFTDLARGIDGVIDVYVGNQDLLTDRWVLNAYDNFHYHYQRRREVDYLRAWKRGDVAAAQEICQ